MPTRADFSAELILVCNGLDAGGIERVVATLANEWSRRGRKVCVMCWADAACGEVTSQPSTSPAHP